MKRSCRLACAAALAAGVLAAHDSALAGGVDVGVSVQISQPGVYGRVDIGRFPQPAVVLPQPVIIAPPPRPPAGVVVMAPPPPPPAPVYMWVPPGQRMHWRRYCGRYGACGLPVYFVQDAWYARHVQPRDRWRDHDRRHGRGEDRDHDDDRDGGRRHGRG